MPAPTQCVSEMSIYMPEWNNKKNKVAVCHINWRWNIKPYVKCEGETISETCKRNDKISFNAQLLS